MYVLIVQHEIIYNVWCFYTQLVDYVPHGFKELNYISKMPGNKTDVLKLMDWSITLITSKCFAKMLSDFLELLLFTDKKNIQNTHMEKTRQYRTIKMCRCKTKWN